jgi:hypothetical protein
LFSNTSSAFGNPTFPILQPRKNPAVLIAMKLPAAALALAA